MHASYLVYDKGRGSCKYFVRKGKTIVLFRGTDNKGGGTKQLLGGTDNEAGGNRATVLPQSFY
jgi:hypothetical protein